jgi:hypothetical protein
MLILGERDFSLIFNVCKFSEENFSVWSENRP